VLLAASTREGEEALLFAALAKRPLGEALLVVVPRHPQRFEEVAALAGRIGLTLQRRSDNTPINAQKQVLLGDSMGELFVYYAACDVAFIGGSLLDYGCQNLIEACAVGKPVLVGRSTFNFAQAAEQALACGAARQIGSAEELLEAADALLRDEAAQKSMGTAGIEFAARHRGATQKTLEMIERYL
jgi:3-deoxy-D-manno-octulosonic-acid transferase